MKKLLMLLLIPTILLCGCHANSEKEDVSEYYEELSKAQEISILPANTSTATQTLTESEEISDFILALDMEHWEMKALPKEAELAGTFQLSQEEIPYVTLKIAGMKMTFKVSDAAMEYLTNYFR